MSSFSDFVFFLMKLQASFLFISLFGMCPSPLTPAFVVTSSLYLVHSPLTVTCLVRFSSYLSCFGQTKLLGFLNWVTDDTLGKFLASVFLNMSWIQFCSALLGLQLNARTFDVFHRSWIFFHNFYFFTLHLWYNL